MNITTQETDLLLGFKELNAVCMNLTKDIKNMEKKLNAGDNKDVKIPSVEPMDPEKKKTKEKLRVAEEKQASALIRYNTYRNELVNVLQDIHLLRQNMRYQNSLDQTYQRTMQPVDFEVVCDNLLVVKESLSSTESLSNEEVTKLVNGYVKLPREATPDETVEFMKLKFASLLLEKKSLHTLYVEQKEALEKKQQELETKQKVEVTLEMKVSNTERTGVLLIRGSGKNDKWQRKLFSLTYSTDKGFFILSYKNRDGKGPIIDEIALPWSVSQILMQDKGKAECCFTLIPRLVKPETKVWKVAALTTPAMLEWLSALHTASTVIPSPSELPKLSKMGYQMIEDIVASNTSQLQTQQT